MINLLPVWQIMDTLPLTDEYYRHALYLLVKLSANTNILPRSLFVRGVDIPSIYATKSGGSYADIYRGRYEGFDVAVKKLRFYGEESAHLNRVGHIRSSRRQLSDTCYSGVL
jgi:hypothetical protein